VLLGEALNLPVAPRCQQILPSKSVLLLSLQTYIYSWLCNSVMIYIEFVIGTISLRRSFYINCKFYLYLYIYSIIMFIS